MAFLHGIHVIEIASAATMPLPARDTAAPVVTSPLSATTAENSAWAMNLTADEGVSFAKRPGADGAAFTLAGAELSLPPQDFDAGVTALVCNLVAMDQAGNVTNFAVTVTIGDVDDTAPFITSVSIGQVDEDHAYAITLAAAEAVTFEKRSGADAASFNLAGVTLSLPAQDYEAGKTSFTCNLRAIDGAGNVTDFVHTVQIRDTAEPGMSLSATSIPANAPADAPIGTLSGGTGFYALTDSAKGRFKIADNELRATGAAIGRGPHNVTVTDFISTLTFALTVNAAPTLALAGSAPVRGWTPEAATGGTIVAAFGSAGDLTLNAGASIGADLGPLGQDLLRMQAASGQYGSFPQVTLGSCEIWAVVAVAALAGSKTILGRAGAAQSSILVQTGGTGLNVRTQGGAATVCPGPFPLDTGLRLVRLRYDQATGFATPWFEGIAGTPTSVGTEGFVLDQLGRTNAGTPMDGYLGPVLIFDRLLSVQDAAAVTAYLEPWRMAALYVSAAGNDASTTPWSQSTPRQTLGGANGFNPVRGTTIALKRGEVFRPGATYVLPDRCGLDGGLWGAGAQAEMVGSTAPVLTLVAGTTYSFPLAAKPVGYVFRLGANRALVERLVEDTANPTTPAAGKWGWSAGTAYVNSGVALAAGDIEASIAYVGGDFLTIGGTNQNASALILRFAENTGANVTGTNFNIWHIVAEANQGDGLDNAGTATGTWWYCTATRNGRTLVDGSNGDGFSAHGTSNIARIGCRAYDNDRTQMRDLVSTTVVHDRCYMRGRQPYTVTEQAVAPSARGATLRNSILIADLSRDTPYGVYNHNVGKLTVHGCSIYGKGVASGSACAVYADTPGGTIEVRNCATFGFDRSLATSAGAAINEDYNVLGSQRTGEIAAGAHSVLANPLFTDPINDNFALQAASPARNAGVTLAGLTADQAGKPRGSPPDIGALEAAA